MARADRWANGFPALEVAEVVKYYGNFCAVDGVSFVVEAGETHALIGPNGAGKSTIAGIVTGDVKPSGGVVLVGGMNVVGRPVWKRARIGLGRTFQVARVFESLTVDENLSMGARRGMWRSTREEGSVVAGVVEAARLGSIRGRRAAELGTGDRKRLEIGVMVAQGAGLVVLDEPTAGMSEADARDVIRLIEALNDGGVGALLIEHDMDVVSSLATGISVLHGGRLVFTGNWSALLESGVVQDVYLGGQEWRRLGERAQGKE